MEDRITEMEFKLTHIEDDLKALNDVIIRQQDHIDKLELAIGRLKDRLDAQNAARAGADPADEVPPHY